MEMHHVDSIERLLSSCQLVQQNANSLYRSRQSCHHGRVKFRRTPNMKYVKRQKLTYVEYFVRILYNIPQLLYDAFMLRSITIAYIIMTMHDIVFSMNVAGGYVVVQRILRLAPLARPSLWRAATCHVRTLLHGPEGVRSWQVLSV